jgi:hypothetical protein
VPYGPFGLAASRFGLEPVNEVRVVACEREKQKVADLQDSLSLAKDQCADGIKPACGKIAGIEAQLAKAAT